MRGGQLSLLTLKNGRPGAFNNPCASSTGEEGNENHYHSLKPTQKHYCCYLTGGFSFIKSALKIA